MGMKDKWNARYREADHSRPIAAAVISENLHLLPESGSALDLACGLGGNALLLAERGLDVQAWDISDVAIQNLSKRATEDGLSVKAQVCDIESETLPADTFDVITVSYYLDRNLFSALMAALRPGGLIFYQTFSQMAVTQRGPANPVYRLAKQELLQAFSSLDVILFREESTLGDTQSGYRDEAMFIGCRPDNLNEA